MHDASITAERPGPSRGLLDSAFRALPDLWFWTKPDGTVVDYYAGHEGSSSEAFVGKRLADVLPGPVAERWSDAAVRAFETGYVVPIEYEMDLSCGPRWFEGRLVRLDSEDPTLLFTARDVTKRREHEERQRHAQKLEALGTLASGHAHNFNNLLMVILGNAERVLRAGTVDGPMREALEDIYAAASRGRDIVDQVLAFSRESEAPAGVVDVAQVVAETVGLVRSSTNSKLRLCFRPGTERTPLKASPAQLSQVVLNLCSNACEAIEGSGTVTVSVDAAFKKGTRYVVIRVADDGVGMPGEVAARAFDPFFTTKQVCDGTGLGLSTVHGIVRSAGGFVRIASAVGKGTTVEAYFPFEEKPSADG